MRILFHSISMFSKCDMHKCFRVCGKSPDWLALVDGYCYVGRQRSWTWIKLDSARSAVPGSTRSANASVAHAYIY